MSLINDALKRASEGERGPGNDRPPDTPLQPVQYTNQPDPFLRLLASCLVVLSLGFASWFLFRWWSAQQDGVELLVVAPQGQAVEPAVTLREDTPANRVQTLPADEGTLTHEVLTKESEEAILSRADSEGIVVEVQEPVVPSPEPEPVPALKLQSIIFRLKNPSAVINGEMLFMGDPIAGARLTKIERHSVTLERDGTNLILTLPRL